MFDNNICEYCEEEAISVYVVILNRNGSNYDDWEKAYGHKRCLFALENAYNRFGKKMTQKEAESERFDPVI